MTLAPMRLASVVAAGAALLLATAACGPSAKRVKQAKSSAYRADYALVWKAALSSVHKGYERLKVEDAENGVIVTDWHKIERTADTQETQYGKLGGKDNSGGIFFRLGVRIEGKEPPYVIVVEGEAAKYRPGYAMLMPYERGAEDEPPWVQGRIDAMYLAIYDQLEQYAVPLDQVQKGKPKPAEPAVEPPAVEPTEPTEPPAEPPVEPTEPTEPAEPVEQQPPTP